MKKNKNIKIVSSTTELAHLLGLSRWTVSRALNGHAAVSPDTATLIKETASEHGFSPNSLGRSLRAGKTNIIGICFPHLGAYGLTQKISILHSAIEACGFHSSMQMTDGSQKEDNMALERFASMRFAGIFLFASHLDSDSSGMRSLAASKIPIVLIDPVVRPTEHKFVHTDRAAGTAIALKHFHSLGHQRVAAMGFQEHGAYASQRMTGIRSACKTLGWTIGENVHLIARDVPNTPRVLYPEIRMVNEFLALPGKRATAILTLDFHMALAAIRLLNKQGIQVPRDVSVICNGNDDFFAYMQPALTSIDSQQGKLMEAALQLLPLTNPNKKAKTPDSILIRPNLILRESTAKAPRRSS